jgi:type I restriction-modification system DNA methylase subunit
MNREQAIALVGQTFRERFDEQRFLLFVRNLTNRLDETKRVRYSGNYIKRAFSEQVSHYVRLGTYTDPKGQRIDILVIHLSRETTLARGRVSLRNFVADYLTTGRGEGKAAVLAAFVSPTEDDWRFSFVKLDFTLETTALGFVTERKLLTPARRYSFLVGKNENCHTAQKQFLELLQAEKTDPTVDELETAFGVEKVTKEFFEHYRELFEKTRVSLEGYLAAAPAIAGEFDRRGITTADFAKKLLGQIVFLYFLQKKGWFGVPPGEAWGRGRRDFVRHLYDRRELYSGIPAAHHRERNFFNDILEPLFYEALAAPRLDDDHYYSRFDCRIPFLNGGLFEPLYGYDWVNTDILLPDSLFSNAETSSEGDKGTGILDVFDRYNFTVNEAEPLEKEVAVDPEMLGKVFENLLPENIRHSSGTYYTPRAIVHYMCQQALLHYLSAHASKISRDELAIFLRLAERFADFEASDTKSHSEKRLPPKIVENASRLDELLATITVCDPAIGSGAFLVAMMHEVVRARMALTPALERVHISVASRTPYVLKREAIQHSLYGVDDDPGAVEIAKLRLWLSVVVDEDQFGDIQPLPNLDYKIMQGNSLIDEFDGIRLFDEKFLGAEDNARPNPRLEELRKREALVQKQVLDLHSSNRLSRGMAAKLKAEAARVAKERKSLQTPTTLSKTRHPELALGSRGTLNRLFQLHSEFFDEASRAKKERLRSELENLEWDFMRATLREQGRESALAALERASAKHRKPFFLWRLHFAEVFQRRGGFDVTIQNPPYVRIQELGKDDPKLPDRIRRHYESARAGNYDLYVVFTELALKLLGRDGFAAFIEPHKFFNANYGRPLRKLLSEGRHVRQIVYFGDHQIFEGTTNYVCVLFLTKQPSDKFRYVRVDDLQRWYTSAEGVEQCFPAEKLTADNWNIVIGRDGVLHGQMLEVPRRLRDVTSRIFQGLKTSGDKVYIVERLATEGSKILVLCRENMREYLLEAALLHPLVKGGDSKAYILRETKRQILFPYEKSANGSVVLISEERLRNDYPLTWKYLTDHKLALRGRERGRFDGTSWYGYGRTQALDVMAMPKIFTPDLAQRASYSFDETGQHFFTGGAAGGYGILPSNGVSFELLLGMLNSSALDWLLRQATTPMRGGWFSYEARYIRDLPIPDTSDPQRHAIETIVKYVLRLRSDANGALGDRGLLAAAYFEQWINALIYELFFPQVLNAAGLYFFRLSLAAELKSLAQIKTGTEATYLLAKFDELYSSSHPLRQSLFALDSIEQVRIIEGKV